MLLRWHHSGGVKLSRSRQAAAELSDNSNSPVFIRISINIRIFPLKLAKDDDSANRLQLGHRSNEVNNRQTEIRLALNLTRPVGAPLFYHVEYMAESV